MEKIDQMPNFEIKKSPEDPMKQKIKSKILEAYKRDLNGTSERILAYNDMIKQKYPDYRNYQLYHVLIGSTPIEEKTKLIDFPSPDSVEEFIETL
jgi:hypothetical protein